MVGVISIEEQVRGRSYRGFIAKEYGGWLVTELGKLVDYCKDINLMAKWNLQWRDHQATVVMEIMETWGFVLPESRYI